MHTIDRIYIDGEFVAPHGEELHDLVNPVLGTVFGRVRLGDVEDTRRAIAAAKRAFPSLSKTSKNERLAMLRRLHDAVAGAAGALTEAIIEEYGAPFDRSAYMAKYAANAFANAARTLEAYDFTRRIGIAEVIMEPLGVVGLITPWNSSAGFVCNKLAMAIAAGCTTVIKPSEMSALQTQALLEAVHGAGLPRGVINIVNGRGDVVGAEISAHPDIAKISFTGSTAVGKAIFRASAETMKRLTLELGGKSPTVILDDAELSKAVPTAIAAGFQNSGQACLAGTRILVPEARLDEVAALAKAAVATYKVGRPHDPDAKIGPMVSARQWERVQRYIHIGISEGAEVITGGPGKPAGLEDGFFVRPTVFAKVTSKMTVAQEEIFGPVLCILTYRDEDEAVAIANDTVYGLQAYVLSSEVPRARAFAERLVSGRVLINGLPYEPLAPFGGFRMSGIGREFGVFGLEAHLEPKSVLGGDVAA